MAHIPLCYLSIHGSLLHSQYSQFLSALLSWKHTFTSLYVARLWTQHHKLKHHDDVNNGESGDSRRLRTHYDVIVMRHTELHVRSVSNRCRFRNRCCKRYERDKDCKLHEYTKRFGYVRMSDMQQEIEKQGNCLNKNLVQHIVLKSTLVLIRHSSLAKHPLLKYVG